MVPRSDRTLTAGPERLVTSVLMVLVALATNSVRPSHEEIRSQIERSKDSYFRAFLGRCMARVSNSERAG